VASENRVDLTSQLEGFSKSEILSATVVSATLFRRQPVEANLGELMDAVALQLDAAGLSRAQVAGLQGLPDDNEATLDLASTGNVTGFVRAPTFGAVLNFTGLDANDYVFEVRLRLRIQVEGV
jgi:hypothetical protein